MVLGGTEHERHQLRELLSDERLKIAVEPDTKPDSVLVTVPATLVMHPKQLTIEKEADADLVVDAESPPPEVPFAFAPINVTDEASHRTAERALFRALRKPADGFTSRYLNRYLSLPLSRFLVKTPLSPNQLSVAILAIGLSGAALAVRGDYAGLLLGATAFQAQSVLDGCDGEMSRVTYRGSLLGEWLDTLGDDVTNYCFFAAAAWGLYRTTGNLAYLIVGAFGVTCGVFASAIEYRYLIRIGSGDLLKYPLSQAGSTSGPLSMIQPLFKRDTFVFLTWLSAVLGHVEVMLVLFSLGAVGILVSVLLTELKLSRSSRARLGSTR